MVLERRHHRGSPDLACPKFFCDYCYRPVEDARMGLYMWDARLENEEYYRGHPVEIFIVHKGACDAKLCDLLGWERHDPATMELATLPVYLGQSMGIRSRKDWQNAGALADFGGSA